MEKILNILKKKNIRPTPQRLQVYKIISTSEQHLDAEAIYKAAQEDIPSISFATIYTILDLFKENKLVKEIKIRSDKSCFDKRINFHPHLLCKSCGQVVDIEINPCSSLQKREINGHLIDDFQGYFYGVCRKCRKKHEPNNKN